MALDPRRAREVRSAGEKAKEWTAKRDELIRAAHAAGGSYREIGALVGLTHVGVMKIVHKGTSLAPPKLLDSADPARRVREARAKAARGDREEGR